MKKWVVIVFSGMFLAACGSLSATETVEEIYSAVEEDDEERADELVDLDQEFQPIELNYQILGEMLEYSGGLDNLQIEELEMEDFEGEYQLELREEIEEMGYEVESTAVILETIEEEQTERTEDDALVWLLEETDDGFVVRLINQTSKGWIEERYAD